MNKLYAVEVYVNNAPSEWHVSSKQFGKPSFAVTDTEGQAELIANAINNHQAMKEALEEILNYSAITDDFEADLKRGNYGKGLLKALHNAKQALTLANGKDKEP